MNNMPPTTKQLQYVKRQDRSYMLVLPSQVNAFAINVYIVKYVRPSARLSLCLSLNLFVRLSVWLFEWFICLGFCYSFCCCCCYWCGCKMRIFFVFCCCCWIALSSHLIISSLLLKSFVFGICGANSTKNVRLKIAWEAQEFSPAFFSAVIAHCCLCICCVKCFAAF